MMTNNILRYAAICNVDAADMVKHLQSDSLARTQFEDWKRENNLVGVEFSDEANTNEAKREERVEARARIANKRALGRFDMLEMVSAILTNTVPKSDVSR